MADSRTSRNKDEPREKWLRMRWHNAALTAKSKLPDVQAPQPRRAISNSQPHESQSQSHGDCPIAG